MIRKMLDKFSLTDLMIIALASALGIAVKPIITPLAHIITGPLFIPGGALAGGIYMLFLVMAVSLTGKPGAATLAGLVQAIIVVITGVYGSHGIMSFLTYVTPGLAVTLVMLLLHHRGDCMLCCFLGGVAANLTGSFWVNYLFFNLPLIPLLLCLSVAILSGGIGGILCWKITDKLIAYGIVGEYDNSYD